MPVKLAILFLARKGVVHLELWERWRKDARFKVVFFVHTKGSQRCASDTYNIPTRVPTRYLHPSIVRAEIELIKQAVRDECTHCVLVSGNTVPLHTPSSVLLRISDAPVTITQYGTDEVLEQALWQLFDAIGFETEHLAYHHQFFAMTRAGMDEVVRDETRLLTSINAAHKAAKQLGLGFCADEFWLNFLNQPRLLSRVVYFEPENDRGRVNPQLTRHIRRMWLFARKFDASHAFSRDPWIV